MSSKFTKVWEIYHRRIRQFIMWEGVFITCPRCKKHPARVPDVCSYCIEEELAELVGEERAREVAASMRTAHDCWAKLFGELR